MPCQKVLGLTFGIIPEKGCSIERLVVGTAALCLLREYWNRLSELDPKKVVKLRG